MGTRWRFINSTDPGVVVAVYDQASAEALVRILQGKLKGGWTVQVDDSSKAAPAKTLETPPQKVTHSATSTTTTTTTTASAAASSDGKERRKKPRIKVKVWVTLVGGTQTFRSYTKEVSMGGLSLQDKVPISLLGAFCRIYVHGPLEGERIELRCRVMADPRNPRRIQFLSPEPEALERLAVWISTMKDVQEKAAA